MRNRFQSTPRSTSSGIGRLSAKVPDTAQQRSKRSLSTSGAWNVAEFTLVLELSAQRAQFQGRSSPRCTLSNLDPHSQQAAFCRTFLANGLMISGGDSARAWDPSLTRNGFVL